MTLFLPDTWAWVSDRANSTYAGKRGRVRRVRKWNRNRGQQVMLEFSGGIMAGRGIWFAGSELDEPPTDSGE